MPKSGRHTDGLGQFYNGSKGQSERGLEWSVVALVDVEQGSGYALSAQQTQTPEPEGHAPLTDRSTRVDWYLGHLALTTCYWPAQLKYVAADAFYSKRKWVSTGMCDGQARSAEKLDYHVNASLMALNLAKVD